MNLLIADDSKPLRKSLKSHLSDISGITEILEAGSCSETINMLKGEIPEIIILDLRLGDGTGFEILAQLHAKRIQTTVIVFTNFSYPQYRENAMRLGAAYFIDKSDENALFDLLSDLTHSSTDKKA